jgi:hypothetical protein
MKSKVRGDRPMAKSARAVLIILLALPGATYGHGFRRAAPVANYYYPAPAYSAPAVAMPTAVSVPYEPPLVGAFPEAACPPAAGTIAGPLYAEPTPAPPSTVPSMPQRAKPGVSESHSSTSTAHYQGFQDTSSRADVGFWNLTNQELTLKVDGKSWLLNAGQSVRLSLARRFAWQVNDRDPQIERLADQTPSMEIIVRR